MLRSVKALGGYTIHATDGDIGNLSGCYFDDQTWVIRYFIIDTGNWLRNREVLLAPMALGIPDWEKKHIPVLLTKKQVENSPLISSQKPVSRQLEEELNKYYGWLPYWIISASQLESRTEAVKKIIKLTNTNSDESEQLLVNPNLRSNREVIGYAVSAIDGEIGNLDDFLVDDQMWPIRYLVVAMEERKVLISPHWVDSINWLSDKIDVDLDSASIKYAPDFDPNAPVNREYEVRLYDYYGRPKYWI